MESRCFILLRTAIVLSFFIQQSISEEIICGENPKCLLQGSVNTVTSGYLPPKVVNFFYQDSESMTAFTWKMDPNTDITLLDGFQMSILGTNDKTNGVNDMIFFKVQDVNVNDSFRFKRGFQFPGDYKIQMYPMPTDSNWSNKIEKDITYIGVSDMTDIYLVKSAEMNMDGKPRSDLTIDTTANPLPINPFTPTLSYSQVASNLRSRMKGYHILVTCVLGTQNRHYYGVFGTDVDANTKNDAPIRVNANATILPGYYDLRVTPYMDTPLQQCRKPDNTELPCKSVFKTFPIGHFVCIRNGNFSMKCHELVGDTSGHPSFVWAIEDDITSGFYQFDTVFSSKEPLLTTRQVFSCLRKGKNVEQCVDLQNKLESCCILPKQCSMAPAPTATTPPTAVGPGDFLPITIAIVGAVIVALLAAGAIYVIYRKRFRKISLLVLDFRKFPVSWDYPRERTIRNVKIKIVDLGEERSCEIQELLKRSNKVMCLFSSDAHLQDYKEQRHDSRSATTFYHVMQNLQKRTYVATFDSARSEQPGVIGGADPEKGAHVYHLPQDYQELLKTVNPRLVHPRHIEGVTEMITRYKAVIDPTINVNLDQDLLFLIMDGDQPDWS